VTYLVDSDWLIDFLDGRRFAVDHLTALLPAGLATSIVAYGEVVDGVLHGRSPATAGQRLTDLLSYVDILPLTLPIMRLFGQIRGDCRVDGHKLGDSDLMIACTAIHHGLVLVTRNLGHYEYIPDLIILPVPTS
jgi:predicted nucleic acid-binding protein